MTLTYLYFLNITLFKVMPIFGGLTRAYAEWPGGFLHMHFLALTFYIDYVDCFFLPMELLQNAMKAFETSFLHTRLQHYIAF